MTAVQWLQRLCCLTLIFYIGLACGVKAAGDREVKLEALLQESIDLYELKQYVGARAKLDALLAMDPTNTEAYKLRRVVGAAILSKMTVYSSREGRDLGDAPVELLRRAGIREQKVILSPNHIKKVIAGALHGNSEMLVEVRKLGQFALPELLQYLRKSVPQDERINASAIMTALGTVAVAPLAEALETTDSLQRQNIIQVLDEIRPPNPRVLAPLKRIYDNKQELGVIREWARKVMKKITNQEVDSLPGAADYYYREARRYYLHARDVSDEMDILNQIFWVWNKEKHILEYHTVPHFALPVLRAEEAIFDGLAIVPKSKRFFVLLASVYIEAKAQIDLTAQSLNLVALMRPDAQSALKESKVWQQHLRKNGNIATIVGPGIMVEILNQALLDGKIEVAISTVNLLADILQDNGGWSVISVWQKPAGAKLLPEKKSSVKIFRVKRKLRKSRNAVQKKKEEPNTITHPLLRALSYPHRQLRIAAANCLTRIKYPVGSEKYNLLLPTLIEGAEENAASVLLLISHMPKSREAIENSMAGRGVQVMTAASGRQGLSRAKSYPPKDVIFIDGDLEEFAQIKDRLAILGLVADSPLPLTIITSSDRVLAIKAQFASNEYRVSVLKNQNSDDAKLYGKLTSMHTGKLTPVVIITNPEPLERARLKQLLEEKAQRFINPGDAELGSTLKKSATIGVISAYVNVFLDQDISGYDAMRTVIDLQKDPRTRPVPVVILVNKNNRKRVSDRFAQLLKNKEKYKLLEINASIDDMLAEVRSAAKTNKLSQNKYVRKNALKTAVRSAESLLFLEHNNKEGKFSGEQIKRLTVLLKNRDDLELKKNVVRSFGHFKTSGALVSLARIVKDGKSLVLRQESLKAIGFIDVSGELHELKLHMLFSDKNKSIQDAASWALAVEKDSLRKHKMDFQKLRVGDVREPVIPENLGQVKEKAEEISTTRTEEKQSAEETSVNKTEDEEQESEAVEEKTKEKKKEKKKKDDDWDW